MGIKTMEQYVKVCAENENSVDLFARAYAHTHGPNSGFGALLRKDKIMKYGAEIYVAKDTSHYIVRALEGPEEKQFERVEDLLRFSLKSWREGKYRLVCRVNCKG